MTHTNDRDSAAELAQRISRSVIDPSKTDESARPQGDRPPGFADALMAEEPVPDETRARLSAGDWQLIRRALEHYAGCKTG